MLQQEQTSPTKHQANNNSGLSEDVLNLLLEINGSSSGHNPLTKRRTAQSKRLDPRSILRRIGETNPQFECFAHSFRVNGFGGGLTEQQDAQELLQALLGVIIHDAHLDSTSSSVESSFVSVEARTGDYYMSHLAPILLLLLQLKRSRNARGT